jgi:IclR family acetate operon transcriptional repressor
MEKRYEVKSLTRALDVVEAVGASSLDGLGISEIARIVGTTKSNAYGIVQTLCDRGFLSDSGAGATRRYRLGPSFLRLATVTTSQRPLAIVARGILSALTGETGMTSRFAVFEDGYAVALVRQNAPGGVEVAPYLGRRELAHSSGIGKAMLASLPDKEIRGLAARIGLERRTARTITDIDALLAEIHATRQAGFAVDDEEDMDGVLCAAAVVRDHQGMVAGAISVSGLKLDKSRADIESIGRIVKRHADQMSAELGFRPGAAG